jgi:hypothetical protein
VIAAVVVGVIAIIKSRSANKIHQIYNDKRANRTDDYNSRVNEDNHKAATIQTDINTNNAHISTNTQLIAEDNAKIYGATSNPSCSSDPVCQHNIQMWSADAIKLGNDNQSYVAKINQDNLDLANWNNPVYLQGQLTLLQQNYNQDMTQYNQDEQSDVSMVPQRQALGKQLGIGAAIGGAIGIYFIIDGAQGC